jgi:hypothetical protein
MQALVNVCSGPQSVLPFYVSLSKAKTSGKYYSRLAKALLVATTLQVRVPDLPFVKEGEINDEGQVFEKTDKPLKIFINAFYEGVWRHL